MASQNKVPTANAVKICKNFWYIFLLKHGNIKIPSKVKAETITIAIVPYPYS